MTSPLQQVSEPRTLGRRSSKRAVGRYASDRVRPEVAYGFVLDSLSSVEAGDRSAIDDSITIQTCVAKPLVAWHISFHVGIRDILGDDRLGPKFGLARRTFSGAVSRSRSLS